MLRRRTRTNEVIAVSEAELGRLTKELDELHHDQAMPAMRSSLQAWIDDERQGFAVSRRSLLLGSGAAVVGGVLLAACGGSGGRTTSGPSAAGGGSGSNPAKLTGDLKVAALAASLENLGVFAYQAGLQAAQAGKLGPVPPAVATFATTALAQHQQHAAAWNSVLRAAGKGSVTETDPALTPTVNQKFAQVTDVGGLAQLALEIEGIAAQTYQVGVGALTGDKAVATAASIQPVELQHAAILNLVLGQPPVPNAFNPTSDARSTSDLGS
jgi:hypothetical protein